MCLVALSTLTCSSVNTGSQGVGLYPEVHAGLEEDSNAVGGLLQWCIKHLDCAGKECMWSNGVGKRFCHWICKGAWPGH